MKKSPVQSVALKNLGRRPVRTWCMIFFVFMLAASLFLSSVLVESLEGALERTTNRMGADVIVVPKEYERAMADSLFLGEMCNFTFDKKWLDEIMTVEGIAQASPQLYMASLDADCCADQVQLVAFDPDTDFIVTAWLEDENIKMPEKGEVIIGSKIEPSETGILLFDKSFPVVGQLEQSNTNFDTCAFMTYETAQEIMSSERWYSAFRTNPEADKLVSSLMIRTAEGVEKMSVARKINYNISDDSPVSAYTTSAIMSEAMESAQSMKGYSTVLIALIFILVIIALLCIFTITINERTKEFGILASLGASSSKLSGIVLTEGIIIGLAGGLLGSVFSAGVLMIFKNTLITMLELPKLDTGMMYLLILGAKCMALALVVSVIASLYSAWKVSRNDLDTLIKGEEL